jgi:hypothetical protein
MTNRAREPAGEGVTTARPKGGGRAINIEIDRKYIHYMWNEDRKEQK